MLRRSKTLSIVMSLCLCLAMLAPVFVAPQAAQATDAITYRATTTANLTTSSKAQDVNIGVLIDVPEASVLGSAYNFFSVKLPSGIEFEKKVDGSANGVDLDDTADSDKVNVVAGYPQLSGKSTLDFAVKKAASGETKLLLTISRLVVKSGSGDINLEINAPSGSAFPKGTVKVGTIASGGQTNLSVDSVKDIGDGSTPIGDITIEELVKGTLAQNNVIKLSLPKGFEWDNVGTSDIDLGWAFAGATGLFDAPDYASTDNHRDLTIKVAGDPDFSTPGKLTIKGLSIATTSSANFGDVEVSIDCDQNSDVTEQDVLIAKYADYGVTVTEGTKEDVTAGREDQEIGNFLIEESIAGSIVAKRTIDLELPDGVEWQDNHKPVIDVTEGDWKGNDATVKIDNNDKQLLKITAPDTISTDASTLKIKSAKVRIKPDFEGPIEITVSGSAGVKGTVVVGEAKKPVKISAENVKDIIVGQANQKVADIVLTESDKDMIMDEKNHKDIVIGLDEGYKFSAKPTVTVEEGNLEIDSTKLQDSDSQLKIVVKYGSTKASKIRISDVAITALRYVPVGPVKAELVSAEVDNGVLKTDVGSTALVDWATDKSMGNVIIANCVTPAEGVSAQFTIGSNVYTVNGVAKFMDANVAPYIKNSRTYVPVRYLAYALGVTENDVVWDATTSKVTITKGDKVVELTIGSTTITVNGEAQTMDVAPEIVNSRTMLPARFVAEGLGATVGWDAASNTVYVQQ